MEYTSKKEEHLCPWSFLHTRYTCSLEVWICAFSHAALALFQKRVSQGDLSHVQQTICSGDKFPTLLRALPLSAALSYEACLELAFVTRPCSHAPQELCQLLNMKLHK